MKKLPYILAGLMLYMLAEAEYPWLQGNNSGGADAVLPAAPEGFVRITSDSGSFAYWLQHLPLKEPGARVHLYDGSPKQNQKAAYRVIDIDVGERDLQQCADAVIRLRAEYLFSVGRFDDISFNFTSGDTCCFRRWIKGCRPSVNGNKVSWNRMRSADSSYAAFRDYLNTVFMYAGTHSLEKEMKAVTDLADIKIGDVFIQGGFPGHAVMVIDMAKDTTNNKVAILLAQSYTPAQEMHILSNPEDDQMNPWFLVGKGGTLETPEWEFKWSDLRRFE